MYRLKHYVNSSGDDLFGAWLDSIIDIRTRSRIAARLLRLNNGNFGDCKPVGEGVWELRVDTGPGYRIYYAIDNGKWFCFAKVVISGHRDLISNALLCAGKIGKRGNDNEDRQS